MAAISAAKDELLSPDDYAKQVHGDTRSRRLLRYTASIRSSCASNALDFDDLIFRTVGIISEGCGGTGTVSGSFPFYHGR